MTYGGEGIEEFHRGHFGISLSEEVYVPSSRIASG